MAALRSAMLLAFGLALLGGHAAAAPTPTAIPIDGGFLSTTGRGTIARFQYGPGERDWAVLEERARAAARAHAPRKWRVLCAIVRTIDADWKDAQGAAHHAKTAISDEDAARCRAWFEEFRGLALTLSGGALGIDAEVREIGAPVPHLDEMGEGVYWLSPATALESVSVEEGRFDSIIVYYRPGDVPMGLWGGALGKDAGIAGAAVLSVGIGEDTWAGDMKFGPWDVISVVTLHEWLHHLSFCAQRVMGYAALPDCHGAEEHGFRGGDGGYPDWMAWYRALGRSIYPRAFWRAASMAGPLDPTPTSLPAPPPAGPFFAWSEAREDWPRRLPALDEGFLREWTGLPGLTLSIRQRQPNDGTAIILGGFAAGDVLSRVAEPDEANPALDNVLSLERGETDASLEALALVRLRAGDGGHRDLVLVRLDVADPVLALLDRRAPGASRRLLGTITLRDPSENEPITAIALETDLGDELPRDEVEAVGAAGLR